MRCGKCPSCKDYTFLGDKKYCRSCRKEKRVERLRKIAKDAEDISKNLK